MLPEVHEQEERWTPKWGEADECLMRMKNLRDQMSMVNEQEPETLLLPSYSSRRLVVQALPRAPLLLVADGHSVLPLATSAKQDPILQGALQVHQRNGLVGRAGGPMENAEVHHGWEHLKDERGWDHGKKS